MKNAHREINAVLTARTHESELIEHAAHGNADAFALIMRQHNQRLFRTARSILRNDAEAEDALQEAYLRAWQALSTFRADARLSTWLVRIVVNESLGRLRRRGAQLIPLDTIMTLPDPKAQGALTARFEQQPDPMAMRSELRHVLEVHIDQLPDLYRTVFVMCAVEEMTTHEVALAMEIPEATVRTRLSRARKLLRAGLVSDMDVTLEDAFSFDGERCDRIVRAVLEKGKGLRFS